MASYITSQDVYDITAQDLSTSDISSDDLADIINNAISQLNNDICVKIYEEEVTRIDNYRKNEIDGSNTYYYTRYGSYPWFLGDLNDDGEITADDVEVYQYDPSDDTRTELTVSALEETGKITLSSAPSAGVTLKITYRKSPVSISDSLLKKACAELAASMTYDGIDAREKKRVGIRGFTISKDPQAAKRYYQKYLTTISRITSRKVGFVKEQEKFLQPLAYISENGKM